VDFAISAGIMAIRLGTSYDFLLLKCFFCKFDQLRCSDLGVISLGLQPKEVFHLIDSSSKHFGNDDIRIALRISVPEGFSFSSHMHKDFQGCETWKYMLPPITELLTCSIMIMCVAAAIGMH